MTEKNSIFILFLLSCMISFGSSAQITYVDAGLSFSSLKIDGKRKTNYNSKLKTGQIHIGWMHRFNEHFGLGVDIGVPFAQKSKYTFSMADASSPHNGRNGEIFNKATEERYKPQKMDYNFKQSIQIGLVGRLFLNEMTNLYLDVRVSTLKLKEEFVFQRIARPSVYTGSWVDYRPAIPAENIVENHQEFLIVPGFALGWQPHLDERFFMNFNLAFDFYSMGGERFSHVVPYLTQYSMGESTTYFVRLADQLTKTKLATTGTVRFGMYF